MLEFEGAFWLTSSAERIRSKDTGFLRNLRVEWRVVIQWSRLVSSLLAKRSCEFIGRLNEDSGGGIIEVVVVDSNVVCAIFFD